MEGGRQGVGGDWGGIKTQLRGDHAQITVIYSVFSLCTAQDLKDVEQDTLSQAFMRLAFGEQFVCRTHLLVQQIAQGCLAPLQQDMPSQAFMPS